MQRRRAPELDRVEPGRRMQADVHRPAKRGGSESEASNAEEERHIRSRMCGLRQFQLPALLFDDPHYEAGNHEDKQDGQPYPTISTHPAGAVATHHAGAEAALPLSLAVHRAWTVAALCPLLCRPLPLRLPLTWHLRLAVHHARAHFVAGRRYRRRRRGRIWHRLRKREGYGHCNCQCRDRRGDCQLRHVSRHLLAPRDHVWNLP